MKNKIKNFIFDNLKIIITLLLLFLIGIIIGFVLFGSMPIEQKELLIANVKDTINLSKEQGYQKVNIISNGISTNAIVLSLMMLSAITIICPFIIFTLFILKGMATSVYICLLFNVFGIGRAILSLFLIVILPLIILMIVYIFTAIINMKENLVILEKGTLKNASTSIIKVLGYYILMLPFLLLSLGIEQIFFRVIINGYIKQ